MKLKFQVLNGNTLKILACLFMLCDHIGFILFPDDLYPNCLFLRYIGRLAFPIFAFFIAEGCKYTRNKYRYFGLILALGLAMCFIQYLATSVYFGNVFLTFSLSILTIYAMMYVKKSWFSSNKQIITIIYFLLLLILFLFAVFLLAECAQVDYGFFGVLLPVFFSLPDMSMIGDKHYLAKFDNLYVKLFCGLICLIFLSIFSELSYQWICLFSLILLALYNGERGRLKLKFLFYIFYPLHIAMLYLISLI